MAKQVLIDGRVASLIKSFKTAQERFCFFDLDGTLAPIVRNPSKIRVSQSVLKCLNLLSRQERTLLAIISGRDLNFLKKFFKNESIILVGSHGAEISKGNLGLDLERMKNISKIIHERFKTEGHKLLSVGGVILESKPYGVAIHYRMCSPFGKKFARAQAKKIQANISESKITIFRGKQVAEINPDIGWNKGTAIESLRKMYQANSQSAFEMYIGDDISDEKAFAKLAHKNHFSIRVRAKKTSVARFYLSSQRAVELFLNKFVTYLEGCT